MSSAFKPTPLNQRGAGGCLNRHPCHQRPGNSPICSDNECRHPPQPSEPNSRTKADCPPQLRLQRGGRRVQRHSQAGHGSWLCIVISRCLISVLGGNESHMVLSWLFSDLRRCRPPQSGPHTGCRDMVLQPDTATLSG